MRATCKIKNKPLSVLMDSGSTHNFMNPSVARTCGLPLTMTSSINVTIADDGYLPSTGCCLDVSMSLQGFQFT
ncbi:hypothetical protein ACHQM5_020514 [Ranunculus cassubicifolius]